LVLEKGVPWPDVPEARRKVMRAIKSKNTKPEMAVRRLVHGMGYRYRLHRKDLPGKPDLTFGPRNKAIFVHGCFWHQHPGCRDARMPATRLDYWEPKLTANVVRDARNLRLLRRLGWSVAVVWECQVESDVSAVGRRLQRFLG